jgi:hypothetical protein
VRLEGLGPFKKIHLIGTRTRDLPACSIVIRSLLHALSSQAEQNVQVSGTHNLILDLIRALFKLRVFNRIGLDEKMIITGEKNL